MAPQSWLVHVEASNQWIGWGKSSLETHGFLPSDWLGMLGFPVKKLSHHPKNCDQRVLLVVVEENLPR